MYRKIKSSKKLRKNFAGKLRFSTSNGKSSFKVRFHLRFEVRPKNQTSIKVQKQTTFQLQLFFDCSFKLRRQTSFELRPQISTSLFFTKTDRLTRLNHEVADVSAPRFPLFAIAGRHDTWGAHCVDYRLLGDVPGTQRKPPSTARAMSSNLVPHRCDIYDAW